MSESRRTPPRGSRPRGRTGPGRGSGAGRPLRPGTPARAGAAGVTGRRRPRLTGRAAILVLVLAVLTVSYASSLRAYLQQRAHIGDLNAQISEREASIGALETEKRRWKDPAYREQQARLRFGYVMPGDRSYVVLDADGEPLESESSLSDPSSVAQAPPTAWFSTVWESVELAGHPPRTGTPPAAEIDGSAEGSAE